MSNSHSPLPQHRLNVFIRHTVIPAGRRIAESIIKDARASATPVVFVTGSRYMPPGRSFSAAEEIFQHRLNESTKQDPYAYNEAYEALWAEVREILEREHVYLGVPENDNSLYAVDLNRWEYNEDVAAYAEDLNDEWTAMKAAYDAEYPSEPGNVFSYPDDEGKAGAYLVEKFGVSLRTAKLAIVKSLAGEYRGRGYVVTVTDGTPADALAKTVTITKS